MRVLETRPRSHNQNQYSGKEVVFSENDHLEKPPETPVESFEGGN